MPRLITPDTASLGAATFAPLLVTPQLVVPATAILATTSQAPSVTVGDNEEAQPGTGSLVLNGFAPLVIVASVAVEAPARVWKSIRITRKRPVTVSLGTAHLRLVTAAPTVTVDDEELAALLLVA